MGVFQSKNEAVDSAVVSQQARVRTRSAEVLTRQRRQLSISSESPQGMRMNMVSFNMLAPCYKRLPSRNSSGRRMRESQDDALWNARAKKTLKFFEEEILRSTSIIGLQEFWLETKYREMFESVFDRAGYDIRILKRMGDKADSVALLIKRDDLDIVEIKEVQLLSTGDRVALIALLKHRETGTYIILANTHLSFPHTSLDKMYQMRQIVALTEAVDSFFSETVKKLGTKGSKVVANDKESNIHRIIMGDFNQSLDSPLCDHLRGVGYVSAFEISPPPLSPAASVDCQQSQASIRDNSDNKPNYHNIRIHRNPSCSTMGSFDAADSSLSPALGDLSPDPSQLDEGKGKGEEEEDEETDLGASGDSADQENSWVSHFTHREEEVGVDHIFFYNYEDAARDSGSGAGTSQRNDSRNRSSSSSRFLIGGSGVLPADVPCATWESGFDISDHRPIGVTLVLI